MDTVRGPSALLFRIGLSPPLTQDEQLPRVRRVRSHDLDLANRCVPPSLATVIGSGLGQGPIGAQGRASRWNQGKERSSSAGRGAAR